MLKNIILTSHNMLAAERFYRTGRPLTQAVLTICVLCISAVQTFSQDWKTVHDGVEYARVEHKIGNDPVKINLLRLDLRKVRLDVHHALDKAIGLETTSSIAKRKGAVAAINSGFFRLDKSEWAGDAAGILVIDSQPISEPLASRIALAIANSTKETIVELVSSDQTVAVRIAGKTVSVNGLNRERKENEVVVFTRWFGPTTLTNKDGIEICVSRDLVASISKVGSSPIEPCGFVVSASGSKVTELERVKVGDWAQLADSSFLIENPKRGGLPNAAEDVVGGVPQLIKNGKIDITWEQEKASRSFVETRHPRTAVAKLKGGKFLMITVDGRQPGVSVGMTLQELAEYILLLGATDAMNLDGGGSTTMYLDGKVVNAPSDKEGERKVGDAIVVTLRKKTK